MSYKKTLKYRSVHRLVNAKQESLEKCLTEVHAIVCSRGFPVTHVEADNQFNCLYSCASKLKITLTTVPNDAHISEVKRFIQTVKERCHGLYNTSPFKNKPIPSLMIDSLVRSAVFWFLAFPKSDCACGDQSPMLVVQGFCLALVHYGFFKWGDYVQTVETTTNTTQERTIGAVFLHPANCATGDFYFMSLLTGKRLHFTKATILPMPSEVLTRVSALARRVSTNQGDLLFYDWDHTVLSEAASIDDDDEEDDDDDGDEDGNASVASSADVSVLPDESSTDSQLQSSEDVSTNNENFDNPIPSDSVEGMFTESSSFDASSSDLSPAESPQVSSDDVSSEGQLNGTLLDVGHLGGNPLGPQGLENPGVPQVGRNPGVG